MKLYHLAVRATWDSGSLVAHGVAAAIWERLRAMFPDALAAVLMPDHLHLAAPEPDAATARRKLGIVVSAVRRSRAAESVRFLPVGEPSLVVDVKKGARNVRYIALNPCRARLAMDPLEWLWSTHRDVVGAVHQPWVTAERLARALGRPEAGFAAWIHRYVSADPSVSVDGTDLPSSAAPRWSNAGLARIVAAAAAATRAEVTDVGRRTITRRVCLELAAGHGFDDTQTLGQLCAMTPRAVRYALAQPPIEVRAAALCLHDDRLCHPHLTPAADWLEGHVTPNFRRRENQVDTRATSPLHFPQLGK